MSKTTEVLFQYLFGAVRGILRKRCWHWFHDLISKCLILLNTWWGHISHLKLWCCFLLLLSNNIFFMRYNIKISFFLVNRFFSGTHVDTFPVFGGGTTAPYCLVLGIILWNFGISLKTINNFWLKFNIWICLPVELSRDTILLSLNSCYFVVFVWPSQDHKITWIQR